MASYDIWDEAFRETVRPGTDVNFGARIVQLFNKQAGAERYREIPLRTAGPVTR